MHNSELLAHVYASIFNYPITSKEAKLWRIKLKNTSEKKLNFATQIVEDLQKIPFILAIFVTGSVAAGNALQKADVDLMIVTRPHTLWLTRVIVVLFLKLKKLYKHTVCPNIFLDTNHLEIKLKNLYTAHEVLQAKCVFDRGNIYDRWVTENVWAKEYLPGAYSMVIVSMGKKSPRKNVLPPSSNTDLLFPLNLLVFFIQYLYMKRKMSNERVGLGYAFFHPNNLSRKVMETFDKKLRVLGIMEK